MADPVASDVSKTRVFPPRPRVPAWHGAIPRRCARVAGRWLAAAILLAAGAIHAASNIVQYGYDAAGNIIAIERINVAPITISGLAPTSGPVGTMVTITGTGFASTPAGNAVTFHGVATAVVGASATTLTVAVPAGAGTGKVAVVVAGKTATSAQDFTVTATGLPTIAAFTPAAGPSGVVVTVDGTNFNPAAGATTVKLNQSTAAVSAVGATQLAFAVPAATGSGRIQVTTGAGSAVGANDFIVPPGGVAAADIIATTRLATGGAPRGLNLLATGKSGLILFDGTVGAWVSLHVGNFTVNPAGAAIAYTIYKPDNTALTGGSLSGGNLSLHLPVLPMAGTYTLLLRTSLAQVSLDAKLESNAFLPADGTTLAVARSAGQSTRALIAGVAGEQKALMVSGLVTVPAGDVLDITVALPNGSTFRKANATGLGTTSQLPPFTVTGTHSVVLVPFTAGAQVSFKARLAGGAAIAVDGAAVDAAIANPGEGARFTFAGIAGENLGLGVSGVALVPLSATATSISVYRPDATLQASFSCGIDGTRCAANLQSLPVTGLYSIIVQPVNGATGTQRLWLSRDVAATLASGTPASVALSRPGQNARLAFAGTAGALTALQVRGVTTNPPGQGLLVWVTQPDKSMLGYTHLTGAGQTLVFPKLPVSGTYSVFIEPEEAAKGAATVTMEVLLDPGRPLVVDGPTQGASVAVAGGSVRYLFAGNAGQNLGLGIGNLALTPVADATVTVYKPDGTQFTAYTCAASAGGCGGNLGNLPVTGTYAIVVRPSLYAIGAFSVTLSSDLVGTLVVGGAPLAIGLDRPGRNARLAFAATAGQALRLNWSAVAIAGAPGTARAYVNAPDGSTVGTALIANAAAGGYDIPALPVTGNYTVFVDPPAGATLSAAVQIVAR